MSELPMSAAHRALMHSFGSQSNTALTYAGWTVTSHSTPNSVPCTSISHASMAAHRSIPDSRNSPQKLLDTLSWRTLKVSIHSIAVCWKHASGAAAVTWKSLQMFSATYMEMALACSSLALAQSCTSCC